jgi:uridine kinase
MRVTVSTKPNSEVKLIGVSGGSGSGKTYFAAALQRRLGGDRCAVIYQDSFYIDQSAKFDYDGGSVNFDHPDSLDFVLLAERLRDLKAGKPAEIPVYDFVTHSRKKETVKLDPRPVILVDGTLIFHAAEVRPLFDDLIFFDTSEDLRFERRLQRDINERGRTTAGVRKQFYSQVKPMHDLYVEPSKSHARTVVIDVGQFEDVLQAFCLKFGGC